MYYLQHFDFPSKQSINASLMSACGFHFQAIDTLQIRHTRTIFTCLCGKEHLSCFATHRQRGRERYRSDLDRGFSPFFVRRSLFLVDSDVKRRHVSFNMQESKLFLTRNISRL